MREFWEQDNVIEYFDQMLSTQEIVEIRGIKFTNEQFQAKTIKIDIGYLNLQNIQEYIENWRKSDKGSEERTLRLYDKLVFMGTTGEEEMNSIFGKHLPEVTESILRSTSSKSNTVFCQYTLLSTDVPYVDEPLYSEFERYEQTPTNCSSYLYLVFQIFKTQQ